MILRDQILKELEELTVDAKALAGSLTLGDEADGKMLQFRFDYQRWYTRAARAVELLARDRYEEFCGYYLPSPNRKFLGYGSYVIQDYLKGVVPAHRSAPDFDVHGETADLIFNQLAILQPVQSRLDSVLASLYSGLLAEIQDAELDMSKKLLKISPRASGALAGVVLEGHLQKVSVQHGVQVTKKAPTIADLNDPLKQAGIYDQPTWRKISFLADIRNLCSHQKGIDPKSEQIAEMIDGVNWVIKNVF